MNGAQCRAARALLGWRHQTLVDKSGVSSAAVTTFEAETTKPHGSTRRKLQATFEAAGIVFVPDGVTRPCPAKS